MFDLRSLLGDESADGACRCEATFDGDGLILSSTDCAGGGDLAGAPDCRATVVDALAERDAADVRSQTAGFERAYDDAAVELLVAAGRFAEAVAFHDERLARLARRDPLAAAREATGRAGPVATVARDADLAECARGVDGYEDGLWAFSGPTVGRWRVSPRPPDDATIRATRESSTGAVARVYEVGTRSIDVYHIDPPEHDLGRNALATLDEAHHHLASGNVAGGDRAPMRAVRAVADPDDPVERLGRVLWKHTRGHGLLEDLFGDPSVSDAFVTAPAAENRLRVRVDGGTLRTNVRLTEAGASALASRFRHESGRAFSRADPTLDATVTVDDRRVRVAGVAEPASDGFAFAFRAHDRQPWTVPALVANGTLSPRAAALLSLAVERGRAVLLAGARGTGKTTLLSALLWELPPAVRTVVIEDAPELPVGLLQESGRDVQGLRAAADGDEFQPAEALRAALRLGDGALVVGEVRGAEAGVLYEAMRVGSNSEAVLGTIHGAGGAAVFDRVVNDLGVPASSFGVTDAVITLEVDESGGETTRRLASIEEVVPGNPPDFEALVTRTETGLAETGRVERGNSLLIESLAGPEDSYASVLSALTDRTERFEELARTGRTAPEERNRSRVGAGA